MTESHSDEAPAPREKVIERPHPLTGIANAWIALVAVIAFGGREFLEGGLTFDWSGATLVIVAIVLGVALLSVIGGVITWRTTTFIVDDEEFRIERSLISRESTRIDFTKVQAVDIHRPLAARLLGLAAVQIDVGGSGGKSLKYLSLERAEELRDHLLARMGGRTRIARLQPGPVRPDDSPDDSPEDSLTNPGKSAIGPFSAIDTAESAIGRFSGEGPGAAGEVGGSAPGWAAPAWVAPPQTVVAVKPVTLVLGVLVSNMVWYILISIVVGVVGLATGTLGVYGFGFLLGAAGMLWKEVAGNWGFVLTQTPDGLHVSRGLTSRSSQSVRQDRIQGVLIQHDFLQRITGLFRVRVTVLGLGDEEGTSTDVMLPYGTWPEVMRVLHAIWPDVDLSTITPNHQPERARWLTPLSFAHHTWGASDQVIVADDGWLSHSRQIVPHRRMQSIGISQGPMQRRLRLASVEIHTTDGPISLKAYHLDEADARRLFDEQNLRGRRARAAQRSLGDR
ncbi:PH domain-containing protein [Tessaracoccus caeni]|uniref:PH domain-containing protein n=1 Tax=Tessaracoccus caeni TaxID=3031239 RepID=UPI0023DCD07A|nr:PH domain-containing protein [Tessaracoccus caeni]MDF1487529.1 PH domain-containing protein [Tessaracoccus caeni]